MKCIEGSTSEYLSLRYHALGAIFIILLAFCQAQTVSK